jgi:erythronate-4-phosphate dehydrogenase
MKIIADENIPFATEAFSALGEVSTLLGRNLQASDLRDCECLLVRSITRVNAELLDATPVKFVASATIGTDHIDLEYLKASNIGFANAPGCNAESASEYMINALFALAQKKDFDPFKLTAGVIGHGNVGSRVKKKLDVLGINTLVNDPPLQDAGDDSVNYVSLQTILHECDFITCHVPLTTTGEHATRHLFNETRLQELTRGSIFFNAARGAVVDNQALSQLLTERSDLSIFLDTWEGEPAIDQHLLTQVDLATPHIAGYSFEGKLRGTQMILDAACDFFDLSSDWTMQDHLPPIQTLEIESPRSPPFWHELFHKHFDVFADHQRLLASAGLTPQQAATEFDRLRKTYPRRCEYNRYQIATQADKSLLEKANELGFLPKIDI